MITNSSMTLCRWEGTEEVPIRKEYIFEKVLWIEKSSSTTSRTGTNDSSNIQVFIPLDSLPENLPIDFEIQPNDFVFKDKMIFLSETDPLRPDIPSTPKDQSFFVNFIGLHNRKPHRVKECIKHDYGSARMQHYELVLA